MLKNHLKIALRSLKAHPMFSLINILGLTLGLTITLILMLFIYHEYSFDDSYVNKDRMYRVLAQTGESFDDKTYATAPAKVAVTSLEEIPEVENAVRILKHGFGDAAYINTADAEYIEDFLYYVDNSFIDMFNVEMIAGRGDLLTEPKTAIISQSTAQRYFGNENVIGELFKIDQNREIKITGVFKDLPFNSTQDGNVYVSFATSTNFYNNPSWSNSSFETYLLVNEGTTAESLEDKLGAMLKKHVPEDNRWYTLAVQPFSKVHLFSSDLTNAYSSRTGSISQVKNLSWLAFLILIIACINYMNLTTARSQKRAREVGVSKTLGATQSNLVSRFYVETGLITLISMVLGLGLSMLLLPFFNQMIGVEVSLDLLLEPLFWLVMIATWAVTTLLAGSYPALFLSSFSAKRILNKSATRSAGNATIRKGLVISQFVASTVLIVGVYVVNTQMDFIRNQDLGFEKDQVVAVSLNGINSLSDTELVGKKIAALPVVKKAGAAQGYPSKSVSGRLIHNPLLGDGGLSVQTNRADADALEVLNLEFIAGINLPKIKTETDTIVDVVINEKAMNYLGLTPENAIGSKISMLPKEAFIRGVVKDFHFESLHKSVGAYAFHNFKSEYKEFLLVKIAGGNLSDAIANIEDEFRSVLPDMPFDYTFIDRNIETLYQQEERTARIGLVFSVLAVFIACLGLFGLASFVAEQRDKEIGVRKVLGASVTNITSMLSADFVKLVGISLIIGFPIAYFVMDNWLQDFAFRTDITAAPFITTGVVALAVAIMTVGIQSLRAALKNPINALRKE